MRSATQHQIRLGDRVIEYRVVRSKVARKLRVRVGPDGVEVVQPASRSREEVPAFLATNELWSSISSTASTGCTNSGARLIARSARSVPRRLGGRSAHTQHGTRPQLGCRAGLPRYYSGRAAFG